MTKTEDLNYLQNLSDKVANPVTLLPSLTDNDVSSLIRRGTGHCQQGAAT